MGLDSIWHWIILLVIVLAIFGTRKLTKIGPDLGRAVRDFKKGLSGDDTPDEKEQKKVHEEVLQADPQPQAQASTAKADTAQHAQPEAEASQSK